MAKLTVTIESVTASSKVDRVTVPAHSQQVIQTLWPIDRNSVFYLEGPCYECGGNVHWEQDQKVKHRMEFDVECCICGLAETVWFNEDVDFETTYLKIKKLVAQGYQVWFMTQLKAIMDAGQYPRWVRDGRPPKARNDAYISTDDDE